MPGSLPGHIQALEMARAPAVDFLSRPEQQKSHHGETHVVPSHCHCIDMAGHDALQAGFANHEATWPEVTTD